MRDPKRIPKILKEIEEVWKKYPDYRLGQLIGNIIRDPAFYYIEDEDFVKLLKDSCKEE